MLPFLLRSIIPKFSRNLKLFCGMSKQKRRGDNLNSSSTFKHRCIHSDNKSINMTIDEKNEKNSIEVMDTPYKSENDKKLYRVIRLPNGLKALLISDPTSVKSEEQTEATAAVLSDDSESGSDESDSDDEADSNNREKLSACSLCVDVGSFSDPKEIQGLAHFLGKLFQFRTNR